MWSLRRARTWVALLAATVATVLASGDGKAGWTAVVGVATYGLALLSIHAHWLDEHPDLPDRRQAKHDELVERALRRYRGEPDPPRRRRAERPAERRAEQPAEPRAQHHAEPRPPREPASPAVRRRRAAVVVALVATPVAAAFGGQWWAFGVGVVTFGVAAWTIGGHVLGTRAEREARQKAKYDAWVEKTLREYRERTRAEAERAARRRTR